MGRSLGFDYRDALDAATRLFWKHGYSGTSLRALLRAMGIGEGSFYHKLKSKKDLYLECLKHYDETVLSGKGASFDSAGSASQGVRALFRGVLDGLDDPESPRVCLVASSVCAEVMADPDLRLYVLEKTAVQIDRLAGRLRADRDAGLLPADFEPEVVARVITTYLHGLYQSTLIEYDRATVERQVDVFLKALGL